MIKNDLLATGQEFSNWKKLMFIFLEILTRATMGLIEEGLLFPAKMLICGWNCIIRKL